VYYPPLNRTVIGAAFSPCPFSFPDFHPSFILILLYSRFCLCRLVFCLPCMYRLPYASRLLPDRVVCIVYLTCFACYPSVYLPSTSRPRYRSMNFWEARTRALCLLTFFPRSCPSRPLRGGLITAHFFVRSGPPDPLPLLTLTLEPLSLVW
jgi:hypothetical protein